MKSPLDLGFLDLKAAAYTSLSVRTLRDHIKKPGGPSSIAFLKNLAQENGRGRLA